MDEYNDWRFNDRRSAKKIRSIKDFFSRILPVDPRNRQVVKISGIVLGSIFLLVFCVFLYFAKDLPNSTSVSKRFVAESTKIYDRTGDHILYEIHGEEKRTTINFQEMPEGIRYATITLEDQDFYNHHGIKFSSIFRAAVKDVLHRQVSQGGSTITQQFVKNSLLSGEKTFARKIKEVILSIELETKFSKDEILGMYLNEIPYGSNAYGIEAASQTFFGKPARDLTLDESALLASLPKAPTYYSPYGSHPEDLKTRQEFTLDRMAELGYITKEQAQAAKGVDVFSKIKEYREDIQAPHFVMFVKEYLESNYGQQMIEQGGLKVYTTLDWDKQQAAEKAVREGADKNAKQYRAGNASLVAVDPKNGQILAMVGSKDYFKESEPAGCTPGKNCVFEPNVNVAVRERQPGSSFKPYVYLTAFEKGYTPETLLWDVDTEFDQGNGQSYNPKNYDGKNHGLLKMKDALAMSLNVPAVKTLYLAGVKNSINTAKSMGITSLNYPADRYGLSLVLGGGEVKLIDHVGAFGTLATGGIRHKETPILRIEDGKGEVMEEYQSDSGERVIDQKYVSMIDYILSTNDLRAPVFGDKNPLSFNDRQVAAKTGTTNEWRDGWTIGYTPYLVAGVWAGNNDNSPMAQGADGIFVAAPIWRSFMDEALKNYNKEDFPKYEQEDTGKDVLDGKMDMTEEVKVCKIPGKKDGYCLANDSCPDKEQVKKKFFSGHTLLWYVNKDDPRSDTPKNPENDPQFKNWEAAVQEWAKKENYDNGSAPKDACKESDFKKFQPTVSISSPSDGDTINNSHLNIKISGSAGFGVKKTLVSVDSKQIASKGDDSFEVTYDIPEEKWSDSMDIEVKLTDKADNTVSDKITVDNNIVATP